MNDQNRKKLKTIELPCEIGDKIYTIDVEWSPCDICFHGKEMNYNVQTCALSGKNYECPPQKYFVKENKCEVFLVDKRGVSNPGYIDPYGDSIEYSGCDNKVYYTKEEACLNARKYQNQPIRHEYYGKEADRIKVDYNRNHIIYGRTGCGKRFACEMQIRELLKEPNVYVAIYDYYGEYNECAAYPSATKKYSFGDNCHLEINREKNLMNYLDDVCDRAYVRSSSKRYVVYIEGITELGYNISVLQFIKKVQQLNEYGIVINVVTRKFSDLYEGLPDGEIYEPWIKENFHPILIPDDFLKNK